MSTKKSTTTAPEKANEPTKQPAAQPETTIQESTNVESPLPGDVGVQSAAAPVSPSGGQGEGAGEQPTAEGQGINIADEALKAHIQAVDPNMLIGIPVQYHDNGNGTTQRPILPAQMLQNRNGQPDILVVFSSTVPMELKAWFAGDPNRNTTEPYWTIPGMGA